MNECKLTVFNATYSKYDSRETESATAQTHIIQTLNLAKKRLPTMGCQPSKASEKFISHSSTPTPVVQTALREKGLSGSDLVYWWQLTPSGYRKLQCTLAKGYILVPLFAHIAVGQCILANAKANLIGGMCVLTKDRIFKVQIGGEKVLKEVGDRECAVEVRNGNWI